MTPLQQAAQAMIDRWDSPDWKDTPHTAEYIAELRKALDAELAQSVEPVAWATRRFDGDLQLFFQKKSAEREAEIQPKLGGVIPLYLHPPQPQATTPSIRQHCRECANWAKAVADTKEWAEGVKIGREITRKLAAAQGEKP